MRKAALMLGICFIVLGLFIPVTTTLVTFMLPETFASSTKVLYATNNPAPFETAVGKIISRSALEQVAVNLHLTTEWAKKYKQPTELSLTQCYEILSKTIAIGAPRGSAFLDIEVHSYNREEAAAIANEIAAVYLKGTRGEGAALIQRAEPALRPKRPNKRLNITLGAFAGATLLIVGIGLLVARRIAVRQE